MLLENPQSSSRQTPMPTEVRMFRLTMVLVSVCILALPFAAWSTTLYIDQGGGGDYTTISEGIAAASEGDTVLIAAGTYADALNTDLDFEGKGILVVSESGPEVTIIDCVYAEGPYRRAFFFHSGEDTTSIVDGLTITEGVAVYGGGINCTGASPLIRNCIFTHCGVAYGGGMYFGNSNAVVRNCRFENNDVFVCGGAFFCDNASPTITDCVIDSCTAGFIAGGILLDNGGSTTLRDVSITNCYSKGDGGGIYCQDAPPYLERVEFIGNMADTLSNGGGMYTSCDATLVDCLFQDNFADNEGGGIWCTSASVDIVECTFSANEASGIGGGIYSDDAMLQIAGGQFDQNAAFIGGGIYCFGAMPEMAEVLFVENDAYLMGGAIVCDESMATIDECIFTGNTAMEGAAIATYGSFSSSITNSTLSGNIAWPGDAAIYAESNPSIVNTIIAFTENGGAIACGSGALPSITRSCSFGNAAGDSLCGNYHDNMFQDPLFCDAAGGNLNLHDDSPCLPENNVWAELVGALGAGGCGPSTSVDMPVVPASLVLFAPSPNPFTASTTISYHVPAAEGRLELAIYNAGGRVVRTVATGQPGPGAHVFVWDGTDDAGERVSSGVYFVRASLGFERAESRIVLIK